MNKIDYENKIMEQLNDQNVYLPKDQNDMSQIKKSADDIIYKLYTTNIITQQQKRYLTNFQPKCPTFYGIPKIHKQNIPLRPIVSQIEGPTSKINELVDYYLSIAEKHIPDLLQDTTAYLNLLNKYQEQIEITDNTYLISLDVVSLYTNIPHEEGAQFVSEFYEETKQYWNNPHLPLISAEQLKTMILFILNNTTFTFNNKFYSQKYGTSMGAIFSVKYANIYMYMFFRKFLKSYKFAIPPFLARLVDDIFTIWNTEEQTLKKFFNDLNNYHNTIKFEIKYSTLEIQFLDTITYKKDNKLYTKLYIKPTDNKQYLHYTSSHPYHIKKSLPYSQALRYRRIISEDTILYTELENLKSKFLTRQYPKELIDSQIDKVLTIDRTNTLQYKSTEQKKDAFLKFTGGESFLPLIIAFHPTLIQDKNNNIHQILDKEWNTFINKNDKILHTFQNNQPKIVYKKGKTIAQYVISSKYPPTWHNTDNDQQTIQILTDLLNENELVTFTIYPCQHPLCKCCQHIIYPNIEYFLPNTNMSCTSTYVIYLITCSKCNIKYVGQTTKQLNYRLNNHRSNIKHNLKTAIAIHFNNYKHNISHLKISPLEQVPTRTQQQLLLREKFWINKLHTKYPYGLNYYPIIRQ